jgi:hypothetical protein
LHCHRNFRVFISAEPPPLSYMKNIPEGLLQSCIVVANEPPADLKANISRAWATFSHERIAQSTKPEAFKACLFGLSFFHSVSALLLPLLSHSRANLLHTARYLRVISRFSTYL